MAWPGGPLEWPDRGDHGFSVAQHSVLVERLVAELSPASLREARLMASSA